MITPNPAIIGKVEVFGLSTDSKPTDNVKNGMIFIEMDTSKIYFYDEANHQWREWGA